MPWQNYTYETLVDKFKYPPTLGMLGNGLLNRGGNKELALWVQIILNEADLFRLGILCREGLANGRQSPGRSR